MTRCRVGFVWVLRFTWLVALSSGCAGISTSAKPEPLQHAKRLADWLTEHPLAPDQEITISELGRTDRLSLHLVQIRHREGLHVHERHDLVALLSRGHGTLQRGAETLMLESGSVVVIRRGTPHAFVNRSSRPAVALVVFSPPFDGTDTVPVTEAP